MLASLVKNPRIQLCVLDYIKCPMDTSFKEYIDCAIVRITVRVTSRKGSDVQKFDHHKHVTRQR